MAAQLFVHTKAILMPHWFHNHPLHMRALSARSQSICVSMCYMRLYILHTEKGGEVCDDFSFLFWKFSSALADRRSVK